MSPERDIVASIPNATDESPKESKACQAFERPLVIERLGRESLPAVPTAAVPDLMEAFQNIAATGFRAPVEVSPNVPLQLIELLRNQTKLDECNGQVLDGSVLCYGSGGLHLQPDGIASARVDFGFEPPVIASAFRPEVSLQRDMEKELTPDETDLSGRHFRSRDEVRAFIESPEYREGVFSGLIVRDKEGNDSPIMVARIPHDPADIQKELWAGHLAAVRLYKDTHNGEEPYVVGAFECLLGFAGEQVEIINAAGTYRFDNHSAQYSSDVLHAFGFPRDARTEIKKLKPGADPFFGHMRAREMSRNHAAIDRLYEGAIGEFRNFLSLVLERYPDLKLAPGKPNATQKKLQQFVGRSEGRTREQIEAYRDLMWAIYQYREGSLGVAYLQVKRVKQMGTLEEAAARALAPVKRNSDVELEEAAARALAPEKRDSEVELQFYIPDDPNSPEAKKMARMREYMPTFLSEFLSLP